MRDHDQDHDHSYDHRPLPLSWCVYTCTYRTPSVEMRLVPASCALVYRSDDIFTRARAPRSNLDIRFNSLRHSRRVPRTSISRVVSVGRNLSDTFAAFSPRVPPRVFLPSSYFLISRVVSSTFRTLTSRWSKRIIKSARHSVKPFIVFHVAGFIVLAGVSFKPLPRRRRTSLGRISWRTRSCTRILNVSTIHAPELTRLSDNRSAMLSSLAFKVRKLK